MLASSHRHRSMRMLGPGMWLAMVVVTSTAWAQPLRVWIRTEPAVEVTTWCEPVRVWMGFENVSKQPLRIHWPHCQQGVWLRVAEGKDLEFPLRGKTPIGRSMEDMGWLHEDGEVTLAGCRVEVVPALAAGAQRISSLPVELLWEVSGRRAGRYTLWMEVAAETWDGKPVRAVSNRLELVIRDVETGEQEACRLFRSGRTEQLLRDYPTSRYAAWVVVQQLGIVGFWKGVGETRQAIARDARRRAAGCYRWYRYHTGRGDAPHWEAVYFPDTAWTRTSVRWLERILALHGDFPYREEVQASLAMRLLALGHLQRGIGLLRDLAQHARQQRMRRWAGVFLATWQQWMGQ